MLLKKKKKGKKKIFFKCQFDFFKIRSNDFDLVVKHSYQLLSIFAYFNYHSYLNPMIIHLLHLIYWNVCGHPALGFLKNNSICVNEEVGEITLSLLANKLSATKVSKKVGNLRNDFMGLSFFRKLENDFLKKFYHEGQFGNFVMLS